MAELFDLVITGGKVLDGTGGPWYYADLGVTGDRLTAVVKARPGEESPLAGRAKSVIDARGLTVAPGFIDAHSHSDLTVLLNPTADAKVRQGVTTEVIAQCGTSPAPHTEVTAARAEAMLRAQGRDLKVDWRTFGEYAERVEQQGVSLNVAGLVGHGTVRLAVMGPEARRPTADELARMRGLITAAMDEGAFGFSTGLIYVPGSYSETEEVVDLARAAAEKGGLYFTHMRSEGAGLFRAVDEAIRVGREARMPVQISHLKCAGPSQGQTARLIEQIESARAEGIEVTADQYPYTAGSTGLAALLPPWVHEGGNDETRRRVMDPALRPKIKADMKGSLPGWDNDFGTVPLAHVLISSCPDKSLEGKNVQEIADAWGIDAYDAVFDILGKISVGTHTVIHLVKEDDVRTLMRQDFVMLGSDASCVAPRLGGKPHPRSYGTFVRALRYSREFGVYPLATAVHKMTGFPAAKLGLQDRGLIRRGFFADLVVFDPETVGDTATYADPHQFAVGIKKVIVNGRLTVDDGRHTEVRAGRVLRR
ncbi:MAG: N-acyl-D-amino-acid deacylase family protein [Bacillota bacterium]